jgi:hypothetical protein
MRYRLAFAALLLPLTGCIVAPPPPPPYGYPVATPEFGYPGYAYNNGSPTYIDGGVTWPLIFWGGGWGYWDGYHHWHGAPGPVGNWLSGRHPGGVGYHPFGGGPYGRPVGLRGGFPGGPRGYGAGGRPGMGGPGRPGVARGAPARASGRSREEHR